MVSAIWTASKRFFEKTFEILESLLLFGLLAVNLRHIPHSNPAFAGP